MKPMRRRCPRFAPTAAEPSRKPTSLISTRSRSHLGLFTANSSVHIGCCRQCQRRVQGRHPLQTSDALGAAASRLGPDAQAAVVDFNKQGGMSHGKISRVFQTLFGIRLTRGGSTHVVLRLQRDALNRSMLPSAPESGKRRGLPRMRRAGTSGGLNAWLHALVGPDATAYVIAPNRSGDVAEHVAGSRDYTSIMIHDGWSPYDNFEKARHQQCLGHLLRRHLSPTTANRHTRGRLFSTSRDHITPQGLVEVRDRYLTGQLNNQGLAVCRGRLHNQLFDAIILTKTNPANERLAKHLWNHKDDLLTFLKFPGLDATNWRGEQAIRFGVILRKVWGGSRTWIGARAQAILMSVWRTCWQRGLNPLDFLSQLLRRTPALARLPP